MNNKDLENITKDSDIIDPGFQPNQNDFTSSSKTYHDYQVNSYTETNNNRNSYKYNHNYSFQPIEKGNLFSKVSLFTSIIGLLLFCCNPNLGFILAIVAIVLGILSKKNAEHTNTNANIGILLGILSLVINIVAIVFHSVLSSILKFIF